MTPKLREHIERLLPGHRILELTAMGPDAGAAATTEKAAGYGEPMRVVLADGAGRRRTLVWHAASANEFGHDRRADRVAAMVQAYDDFAVVPGHAAALDLGFVSTDGAIHSCRGDAEPYLLTEFAPGQVYAADLREVVARRAVTERDVARLGVLARYLTELHTPIDDAARYRRAVRDLVGSGEGIYGIVDGYPDALHDARLRQIEAQCAAWRWRLRGRERRLARTHGDFHPFNIVFDGDALTLLDASRGACGDPADDLTALAVNFVLFAVDESAAWPHGLGVLWHRWWAAYLAARPDPGLFAVVPPFFAWRTLVVCNPHFYPKLSSAGRDKLLGFAQDILSERAFDPGMADELFI